MRTRAARLLRLAVPLGVLAITTSLQASGRPSFDCSRATKWVERTICDDEALAASDREMSAAYARQRAEAGDVGRKQLVSEQRRWLARREECRSDAAPAACLERMYHDRIVALGGRTDSAPPAPTRPAPSASPAEPRPAAAGALATCRTGAADTDGLCLDRLLAAATAAFGDAEAAMLKRLAGAEGTSPNPAAAEAFRTSQDAFLRFRDATCQWRGAVAPERADSIRQACQVDYTRARTAEITAALR